jgi:hypothetical protein
MKNILFISTMLLLLSSCMTTKTPIGNFKESSGTEYTYAQGKQVWILFGLIPIGRTAVDTPADKNCQVVTKFTFVDFLISGVTGGLVLTETVKVTAKQK